MDKVFQTTCEMGAWMMRNTTSIQINIDYTSEVDANQMGFIADAIQPFFSILFSNAPFIKGKKGFSFSRKSKKSGFPRHQDKTRQSRTQGGYGDVKDRKRACHL